MCERGSRDAAARLVRPHAKQGQREFEDMTNGVHVSEIEKALKPEDLTRLFVERANAGDAAGIAELYEERAVMAYPPGAVTEGREAIRLLWEKVLANAPHFSSEASLPTLVSGDIALTSTAPLDGAGARAQVARQQADGSWLRLLDQPEFVSPT
jgi:ketosteroid isomerase-like protein